MIHNSPMDDQNASATPTQTYQDTDLVYVDPEDRMVVGIVEWSNTGNPKPKEMPEKVKDEKGEKRFRPKKRWYPWGTYRSMKNIYRLEGKQKKNEPSGTLDEVIPKALKDPYWD